MPSKKKSKQATGGKKKGASGKPVKHRPSSSGSSNNSNMALVSAPVNVSILHGPRDGQIKMGTRGMKYSYTAGYGFAGLTGTLGTTGVVQFLSKDATPTLLGPDVVLLPGRGPSYTSDTFGMIGDNAFGNLMLSYSAIRFRSAEVEITPEQKGGTGTGGLHAVAFRRFIGDAQQTLTTSSGTTATYGYNNVNAMQGRMSGPLWSPLKVRCPAEFLNSSWIPTVTMRNGISYASLFANGVTAFLPQSFITPCAFSFAGTNDGTVTNQIVSTVVVHVEFDLEDFIGGAATNTAGRYGDCKEIVRTPGVAVVDVKPPLTDSKEVFAKPSSTAPASATNPGGVSSAIPDLRPGATFDEKVGKWVLVQK